MSAKHQAAITRAAKQRDRARAAAEKAEAVYWDAVRAASTDPVEKASLRELSKFTGHSVNHIRKMTGTE